MAHNLYRWTAFILLATSAILWPAAYNGLAFFSSDTPAYIRGADAAIHAALGVSSEWSPAPNPVGSSIPTAQPMAPAASPVRSLSSLPDKFVLAGRSVYYGALLYLGSVTGGFWLSIVVHGLLLITAVALTLRVCTVTSIRHLSMVVGALCVTPAAWFATYLMPDVFAGLTILACAVLIAAPASARGWVAAFWFGLLAFALLSHSSNLLLAGTLFVLGLLMHAVNKRKPSRMGLGIIGTALAVAVVGGWLFDFAVGRVVGNPPVRPPFLMARMIDDGPGYQYLRSECPQAEFTVCAFLDQLPADADVFLWSADPARGVFSIVEPETRRALSREQYRFAWEVLKHHPWQQARASAGNSLRQLVTFGAREFNFSEWDRKYFSQKLPASTLHAVQRTVAYRGEMPIRFLSILGYATTMLGLIYLVYARTRHGWRRVAAVEIVPQLVIVALAGVAANAAICGAMSSLHDRYQARVIWLLPLMAIIVHFVGAARPRDQDIDEQARKVA
jgi:hypothetical protein